MAWGEKLVSVFPIRFSGFRVRLSDMVLSHLNYADILVREPTARYGQPLYLKLIMSLKYVYLRFFFTLLNKKDSSV